MDREMIRCAHAIPFQDQFNWILFYSFRYEIFMDVEVIEIDRYLVENTMHWRFWKDDSIHLLSRWIQIFNNKMLKKIMLIRCSLEDLILFSLIVHRSLSIHSIHFSSMKMDTFWSRFITQFDWMKIRFVQIFVLFIRFTLLFKLIYWSSE